MKAVIIGTDLLKDSNGNLRIIETNTNVDVHNRIVPDLNWGPFKQLLIDNSITKLHFIYTDGNFINGEKKNILDAGVNEVTLAVKLNEIMNELSGEYYEYHVPKNSITVPYIEDAADTLIIRTAYDTTAVVDESYAKDNVNFHRVISNQSFGPKVFYNSETETSLNIDQLTTLHTNEGTAPNYIVKTRYPNTTYVDHPLMYKINSIEELNALKATMTDMEYIEEYHVNAYNFVNEKIGVIRSLDILYGGNLTNLHLGSYIMTSNVKNNLWETTYDETGKMNRNCRPLWLTKFISVKGDIGYIMDDDTPILYPDGTFKSPNEILANDVVKSATLPWVPVDESDENGQPAYVPYSNTGIYEEDVNNIGFGESTVIGLASKESESLMIRVTLENGITYEDLPGSSMLIEDHETLTTTFGFTNRFKINDHIVFYDYNNNTITKSKITNLEIVFVTRRIYELNVETNDIFLPLADETLGLTFIQHNGQCFGWCPFGYGCNIWCCSACGWCGFSKN